MTDRALEPSHLSARSETIDVAVTPSSPAAVPTPPEPLRVPLVERVLSVLDDDDAIRVVVAAILVVVLVAQRVLR